MFHVEHSAGGSDLVPPACSGLLSGMRGTKAIAPGGLPERWGHRGAESPGGSPREPTGCTEGARRGSAPGELALGGCSGLGRASPKSRRGCVVTRAYWRARASRGPRAPGAECFTWNTRAGGEVSPRGTSYFLTSCTCSFASSFSPFKNAYSVSASIVRVFPLRLNVPVAVSGGGG